MQMRAWVDPGGIALGLGQDAHHVAIAALGLDDTDQGQAREQGAVSRAAGGGPLGDGQITPLGRPRALGVAQLASVGFPAGVPKLLVDDGSGPLPRPS